MVCVPVSLYYIAKNRHQLSKFTSVLNSLSTTDILRISRTQYESRYAMYILPYFLLCTCLDSVQETSVWEIIISSATQFLAHFPVICIVRHFVHFVDQVTSKLKGLAEDLESLKKFASNNLAISGKSETLVLMSDVHYTISVAAAYLNSAYSPQYFTFVSGAVCVLIVNFCKAAKYLTKSDYLHSSQQVCWTAFWLSLVATAILPAAKASKMSDEFNIELSKLIARGQNISFTALQDRDSIIKLRTHVDFNYIVKFSCGFFELDRFLMHSILGGICSFSVILAQISPSNNK